MYTTDVTVSVTTDVEIEPVGRFSANVLSHELYNDRLGKFVPANADMTLTEPSLIVTPKEPAVSEPEKYEIPVEVTKDIYDICSRGVLRNPKRGEQFVSAHGDCYVSTADSDYRNTPRLVLTPRVPSYEYPAELRSPRIWGIAIDDDGSGYAYTSEPKPYDGCWGCGACLTRFDTIRLLHPNIQLPTLDDFGGDWTKAKLQNPNYGKGE